MSKYDKLLFQILRGASDASVPFNELRHLLTSMGFDSSSAKHMVTASNSLLEAHVCKQMTQIIERYLGV